MIDEYKTNLSSKEKLRILRKRNIDKIIVTDLNIISLRKKFDSLIGQITGNTDILMVSESKLNESFPIGFGVPYRVDRNGKGGGVMLFAREDKSSKLVSIENYPPKEFFVK